MLGAVTIASWIIPFSEVTHKSRASVGRGYRCRLERTTARYTEAHDDGRYPPWWRAHNLGDPVRNSRLDRHSETISSRGSDHGVWSFSANG